MEYLVRKRKGDGYSDEYYEVLKPDLDGGWYDNGRKYPSFSALKNRIITAAKQGDKVQFDSSIPPEERQELEKLIEKYGSKMDF